MPSDYSVYERMGDNIPTILYLFSVKIALFIHILTRELLLIPFDAGTDLHVTIPPPQDVSTTTTLLMELDSASHETSTPSRCSVDSIQTYCIDGTGRGNESCAYAYWVQLYLPVRLVCPRVEWHWGRLMAASLLY